MKDGWKILPLGEVCDVLDNRRVPITKRNRVAGPYPYYGASGILDYVNDYIFDEKLILIGEDGAKWGPGERSSFTVDGKYWVNNHAHVIRPHRETVIDEWIVYYLNVSNLMPYITGLTVPKLNQEKMRGILLPVPPIEEQRRIVAILDEAFEAIDKAKQNTAKNLQNARELFDSYLENIFAHSRDDWETKTLAEVVQKTETIDPTRKPAEEFVYLDVSSVNRETLSIETVTRLRGKDAPSRARKLIKTGDVIFATVRPTLRRIALVPKEYDGQVCSTGYVVLRAKSEIDNRLLFFFLQTRHINEQMEALQKGASYPAVTDGEVKAQIISFPQSRSEQQKVASSLEAIAYEVRKLTRCYEQKLRELGQLKKSILQKAFDGEFANLSWVSNVIEFPARLQNITTTDLHAGIIAIALRLHIEQGKQDTFHHVKCEKIVHLAEAFVGLDLGRKPTKMAAGPNDFPRMHKVEHRAKFANFFRLDKQGSLYSYQPGNKFESIIATTESALGDKKDELIRLVNLMVPMKTKSAEILATVFAAWNNLLLDGRNPDKEAIVFEARENWHSDKLHIEREKFFKAINWMREHNIVPLGKGRKVTAPPTPKRKKK